MRIMTNGDYLAHTNPLFFSNNILKVSHLHKYLCCIYAYKNLNNFRFNSHSHNTRNQPFYLVAQFQRLTMSQRSLLYCVPFNYNNLPVKIKQLNNIKSFKSHLVSHYRCIWLGYVINLDM